MFGIFNKKRKPKKETTTHKTKNVSVKTLKLPVQTNSGSTKKYGFYIGKPKKDMHPIGHQSKYLEDEQGIIVSQKVMDSLDELLEISEKNDMDFCELCDYVMKLSNTYNKKNISK